MKSKIISSVRLSGSGHEHAKNNFKSVSKKIVLLAVVLALSSCTKEESKDSKTALRGVPIVGGNKKIDFHDLTAAGYLGQLPYVVATSQMSISEFNAELNLAEAIMKPEFDWKYFDGLYSATLPNDQKQYLAFTILSTKDLIGFAEANPANVECNTALRKYIDVLVVTKYFGYSVLYNALKQVNDPVYAKAKATAIISYSASETFHMDFMNNPEAADSRYLEKVTEDYSYLRDLREMSAN
jgi:hypothetical protein